MTTLHDGFSSATYEPVATHFRGFRAFVIDDTHVPVHPGFTGGVKTCAGRGMLRGIFKREYVWGAGVNHARCLRSTFLRHPIAPHDNLEADCDCGFWAYTNGDHYLSVGGPAALGVVEAWGRMVIGPHGFRAEKARIVALAFPTSPAAAAGTVANVKSANLPAAFASLAQAISYALIPGMFGIINALTRPNSPTPPPPRAASVARASHPWQHVPSDLQAAVKRLYPEVQFFDTVAEMQEAFPLSDLDALLPDDGEDGEAA